MIASVVTSLLSGPIINGVIGLVKDYNDKKLSEEALRSEVEKVIVKATSDITSEQAKVIQAELKAESWLTKSWRPIASLCFVFIVVWYSFLGPITVNWWGWPALEPGRQMLDSIISLATICIGGYVGGRTLEKVADTVMRRWK